MPALNVLSALASVVEWLLIEAAPRPTAVAIYFHLSIAGAVLVSGFWSLVNERLDIQSAKRHIGQIGMGATLGGILGGLLAEGTAAYLTPDSILLVLAGLQLACGMLLFVLRGRVVTEVRAPSGGRRWVALGLVTRSHLLRNLAAVVLLGAVATGVLDYLFKADLVAGASKSGILRSLATYYTVTSLLSAVVQITVCGPLVARLGVARSVTTLPLVVTGFGIAAVAAPVALTALIARAAEAVTRSSIYRAGYELLYAPLPTADKRATKIVLDVGVARVGDLLGAQLVGLIVPVAASPRIALLTAVVVTGALALVFALRLRRSYTTALQDSLVARDSDAAADTARSEALLESWPTLHGLPVLGPSGDAAPLPERIVEHSLRRHRADAAMADRSQLSSTIADLCSEDVPRIKHVLASRLAPVLVPLVIGLVGRDDLGAEALAALRGVAPRCTGMIVDALLDPSRELVVRRRLVGVLLDGEPTHAAWGLWRGLVDPSFEIRYRCGVALAKLAAGGRLAEVTSETAFEAVRRELALDPTAWRLQRVEDDRIVAADRDASEREEALLQHSGSALEHVFTVLGLVFPAEPLRIALHAVHADDASLRATALEYLHTILPADVRTQLWPLIDREDAPAMAASAGARAARPREELIAALRRAYPAIRTMLYAKRERPA
jgi:hypothetical protein